MGATNCPETPRQKMITMMYLVYTAMLALNVSAEVIQGFKSVGTALHESNKNLEFKLRDSYENFRIADSLNNNLHIMTVHNCRIECQHPAAILCGHSTRDIFGQKPTTISVSSAVAHLHSNFTE